MWQGPVQLPVSPGSQVVLHETGHPPWATQATKPPILDLSVDRDATFKAWQQHWDSYFRLSGLSAAEEMIQFDVVTSCLSDDTLKIVDNLDLLKSNQHKVCITIKKFGDYMHVYK